MCNKIKMALVFVYNGIKSLVKPNEDGLYFYGQIKLAIALIIIIVSLLFHLLTSH
jgi:hypothetical protein